MDYASYLSPEILAFIAETDSFYPPDVPVDDVEGQRAVYNRMCAHFHAGRPEGLAVEDTVIAGVPVRIYGNGDKTILFAHGGGFVLGGLDSHDDTCAEIAHRTGMRLVAIDYRLSPEHLHPAAYEDITKVADALGPVVLVGDSAGGTLCATLAGTRPDLPILGQVLIYPMLGIQRSGGSFDTHAHAPMLTAADLEFYGSVRGGDPEDPRLVPAKGRLDDLPPTHLFPCECDPLCSDAEAFAARTGAQVTVQMGLVHGWLRARNVNDHTRACFTHIIDAISGFGG